MFQLDDKRVLITGGSSGIGRALVTGFVRSGARVVFTYRKRQEQAEALVKELASQAQQVTALPLDCAEERGIVETFARAEALLGGVTTLVNNAAIVKRAAFVDIERDELERSLAVNLVGPFRLTQLLARALINRGQHGSIVNISSLSARRAVSRLADYQCSKAALEMLTTSAAYELAPAGIRVNGVAPGLTRTEGNAAHWRDAPELWARRVAPIPMARAGVPRDHVGAVLFLASDLASWITGTTITIDGGQATA